MRGHCCASLSGVEALALAPWRRRQRDTVEERYDIPRRLLHGKLAQIFRARARRGKQELSTSHSALKGAEIHWLPGARDYDVYAFRAVDWQPVGQPIGRHDVVVRENDDEGGARSAPLPLLLPVPGRGGIVQAPARVSRGRGSLSVIGSDRYLVFIKSIIESSAGH